MTEEYPNRTIVKGNVLEKDFLFYSDAITVRFLEEDEGVYSWVAQYYTKEIPALLMAKVIERFFNEVTNAKKLYLPRLKSDTYKEPYVTKKKKLIDYYEDLLRIIQV